MHATLRAGVNPNLTCESLFPRGPKQKKRKKLVTAFQILILDHKAHVLKLILGTQTFWFEVSPKKGNKLHWKAQEANRTKKENTRELDVATRCLPKKGKKKQKKNGG